MEKGAEFSNDNKHRYCLWRIWNSTRPLVMFIGLNPSTANASRDDATVRRLITITGNLGYGGFYIMNCWTYISTDPAQLKLNPMNEEINDNNLIIVASKCKDVIFAYGNFKIVSETGRDKELKKMFPDALALHINKNGSPKHPLYCKSDIQPVKFVTQ